MNSIIQFDKLVPTSSMDGKGNAETACLLRMLDEASTFLNSFTWCLAIHESYLGLGICGVVAAFLFRIRPAAGLDDLLWVIVGDLPPAYLVTDQASNGPCALRAYVREMQMWTEAARNGKSVADLIPVNVPPTLENAEMLERRLAFLDREILSGYPDELAQCE